MTAPGGTHLRSIVINREYGSGGREIGRRIAERAGMEFYDTRILAEAAAARGLPSDLLATFDERVVAGQLFDLSIITGADSGTFSLPFRMYGAIAEVISGAAGRAPAVFIGRCADRILREARIRLRSVFIYSTDTEGKIARAVDVDGIDRRHAESHIAKMDKARARYQQFFTQTTFGDPREYDLCLNSAQLGYEGCVATIMASMNTDVGPSSTPSV
jgi:cytidylate kinase